MEKNLETTIIRYIGSTLGLYRGYIGTITCLKTSHEF